MNEGPKFLTIGQFAEATHYSERRIRQLCVDGKIKGQRVGNARKWLIDSRELDQFDPAKVPLETTQDTHQNVANQIRAFEASETTAQRKHLGEIESLLKFWSRDIRRMNPDRFPFTEGERMLTEGDELFPYLLAHCPSVMSKYAALNGQRQRYDWYRHEVLVIKNNVSEILWNMLDPLHHLIDIAKLAEDLTSSLTFKGVIPGLELQPPDAINGTLGKADIALIRQAENTVVAGFYRNELVLALLEYTRAFQMAEDDLAGAIDACLSSNEFFHNRCSRCVLETEATEVVAKTGANLEESEQPAARARDSEIFKKSDDILSEAMFRGIIEFLRNTCFRDSQMTRLDRFLGFFESETNLYIDIGLRHTCYKLCIELKKLFFLMEIHSIEYLSCKKNLGNKWDRFENALPEANESYIKANGLDEFYLLLPHPEVMQCWELMSKDHGESSEQYIEWKQGLIDLLNDCSRNYSEYRASVRDRLAL